MADSITIDPKSVQPLQPAVTIDPASIQKIGDSSTAAPAPPKQDGFLSSFGKIFGLDSESMKEQAKPTFRHAVEAMPGVAPLEGAYHGFMRSTDELSKGVTAAREGNPSGLLSHGISAVPFLGPAIDKAGEQAPPSRPGESFLGKVKDVATNPGAMGTVMGTAAQVAPLILGATDAALPERGLLGQLPSKARAGAVLSDIAQQAKGTTVEPVNAYPEIQRFRELVKAGGKNERPVSQLGKRLETMVRAPNETTGSHQFSFPEARDYYSNVSDASHASTLSKLMGTAPKPVMLRQLGAIRSAFDEDLTNAAGKVGRAEDYSNAMDEYARAARLRSALIKGGGIAVGAALGHSLPGKVASKFLPTH